MRYPKPLEDRGTIGLVAPSFGAAIQPYADGLTNAEATWERMGYAVKEYGCARASGGIGISCKPGICAKEMEEAWADPETQVLISCGGGELMCEVLSHLDFRLLKDREAKWFMGYSDNTNLGFTLTTLADTASIIAPCAPSFGMEPWHAALHDAFTVLRQGRPGASIAVGNYRTFERESLKDGEHPLVPYNDVEPSSRELLGTHGDGDFRQVSGRILGGTLDCLLTLCGTRFDQVKDFNRRYGQDGVIWFLEACELNPMDVSRGLWQLKEAGWLDAARALVFGRPYLLDAETCGLDQKQAVIHSIQELGLELPVVWGADFGHLPPQMPLVQGALAELSYDHGALELVQRLV